jgi:GNAT superfamily N-acetyltransferase
MAADVTPRVPPTVRLARDADLPALHALIPLSVRGLSRGFYSDGEIEAAIEHVFGPDTQLIADGTYFVVEVAGEVVACGGWSKRQTLYGGDQAKAAVDPVVDPARDPARIRAFFVHPSFARRGLGSLLMNTCMDAARAAGFRRLELGATLPGVPLYRAFGFEALERVDAPLPNGQSLPVVRMARALEP